MQMKLAILPSLLLLAACQEKPHAVVANRMPAPELLERCEAPQIPSAAPTTREAALGWVDAVKLALDCSARFDALAAFITKP